MNRKLNLRTWKKGDLYAPHKPLLLLYTLGAWQQGQTEFSWLEIKEKVGDLLEQFGGAAGRTPQNPFIRLQSDGIWVVEGTILNPKGDMRVSDLNRLNNQARFSPDFAHQLKDINYFNDLVTELLYEHFPETLHEDLRLAVGLNESTLVSYQRRKRNPEFRQAVLEAYQHQCAICGYQLRYSNTLIGIEAAHIQWHNSFGPEEVENGLALCAIHHKLLDYGAIGFNDEFEVLIAPGVTGNDLDFWLHRYKGKMIALPVIGFQEPKVEYLRWQRKNVFKG